MYFNLDFSTWSQSQWCPAPRRQKNALSTWIPQDIYWLEWECSHCTAMTLYSPQLLIFPSTFNVFNFIKVYFIQEVSQWFNIINWCRMFHSQHLHCYHDFLEENEMSILSTTIFDIFWCNLHKNFFEGDKPRVAGLLNRATPLLVWLTPQILNATFSWIVLQYFSKLQSITMTFPQFQFALLHWHMIDHVKLRHVVNVVFNGIYLS